MGSGFSNDTCVAKNFNTANDGTKDAKILSDGQFLVGSTVAPNVRVGSFAAGPGIAIVYTSAVNPIMTISNIAGGFSWTRVAGTTQTIVKQNGYISTNAAMCTFTLPVLATIGDSFTLVGEGTGLMTIAQNANQQIFNGVTSTTVGVGGSLISTHRRDAIEVVCTDTNNVWTVVDFVGNWGAT